MTTEEGSFLRRWSRRKEEARHAEEEQAAAEPPPPVEPEEAEEEAPFDPHSLPPLESLGPDSDYTAFLRRGVPTALRSAALRRAWASQPAIAGHRPLVEYDWNWNAPGYGKLRPTDQAGPLIKALFGHLKEEAPPEPPAPSEALPESPLPEDVAPEDVAPEALPPEDAAPADAAPAPARPEADALAAAEEPPAPRRRHGGAAPV